MLTGNRIYLRNFCLNDAPTLLRWGQDPHYHETAGFAQYQNISQAQRAARLYSQKEYSFAVCLKGAGQLIGTIELYERGMDKKSGLLNTKSLGFMLDKNFEHHGYMTEALRLIFAYAFVKLNQEELWANTFQNNEHSQHLLKKLGFNYVYTVDYSQISSLFSYIEKYYLLKRKDWIRIEKNKES